MLIGSIYYLGSGMKLKKEIKTEKNKLLEKVHIWH